MIGILSKLKDQDRKTYGLVHPFGRAFCSNLFLWEKDIRCNP